MNHPPTGAFEASEAVDLSWSDLQDRPIHDHVLLVKPTHFDVSYEINPYMGGEVDTARAREQWEFLRECCERYATSVTVLDPDETWASLSAGEVALPEGVPDPEPPADLPDLVFAANLGLPTSRGDAIVAASMATEERRGEIAHAISWARRAGYEILEPLSAAFEGTGDALWHPGKRLLWGGYGVRSELAAHRELADRLDVPILALELTDDRYYHLDVCLTPLDETTALIQPEAFTADGLARLESVFDQLIEIPVTESHEGMAGNARCLDGEHVLVPAGNPRTESRLSEAGYEPVPVETGEFEKAGGSVFCLTLALGDPA